jgi:hypothetical protein
VSASAAFGNRRDHNDARECPEDAFHGPSLSGDDELKRVCAPLSGLDGIARGSEFGRFGRGFRALNVA